MYRYQGSITMCNLLDYFEGSTNQTGFLNDWSDLLVKITTAKKKKKKSRLWVSIWSMACVKLRWWWAKVNLISQINSLRGINHAVLGVEENLGITWWMPSLTNLVNPVSERLHFIQFHFALLKKITWNFIFPISKPLCFSVIFETDNQSMKGWALRKI